MSSRRYPINSRATRRKSLLLSPSFYVYSERRIIIHSARDICVCFFTQTCAACTIDVSCNYFRRFFVYRLLSRSAMLLFFLFSHSFRSHGVPWRISERDTIRPRNNLMRAKWARLLARAIHIIRERERQTDAIGLGAVFSAYGAFLMVFVYYM